MLIALLIITLLLLVGRVPIFIALGLPAAFLIVFFGNIPPTIFSQKMFGSMDKFSLMSMPFFVLAANIMTAGGLSRRIVNWTLAVVGSFPGGLAISAQVSAMFFGALSGSSPATVVAIGQLMFPAMNRHGYPRNFSAGLITTGGAVSILIPPSIAFIVYGAITGASVGKLFIAGIGAGIIYGILTLIYAVWYVYFHQLPRGEKVSFGQLLKTTKDAVWALGVPVLILGGIYLGVFTPTEAAGVSAVYATFIGFFIYRDMNIKTFIDACFKSAITSAELMLLCGSAGVLGWVFTVLQVPQFLSDVLLGISNSPFMFLLLMNFFVLIFGCFIDGAPAIVILAPLLVPIAAKYGIDPVHFGVILSANMAIGMFTPPFGLNLIVASSVTKMPMDKLLPGCIPFFIVSLIGLFLITYVEPISMWLPNLVY